MTSTYFIEHRGKKILYLDFAEVADRSEAEARIAEAKGIIAEQKKNSLRTLTVVTGSAIDREITFLIRDLVEHNRPFVLAGAVVGIEGVVRFIYQAVARLTGRSFALFETVDEAKDWLADQG